MALYFPVVTGETGDLRAETESFLSGDQPDVITERMYDLDERAKAAGIWATFGAEVELEFLPDPSQTSESLARGKEQLYEEIIQGVPGYEPDSHWGKGKVFFPQRNKGPIMHNEFRGGTYNHDQVGTDIIEVRTAPENAIVAAERYWDVIESVGVVAARHGYMGMILATHISGSLLAHGGRSSNFLDFGNRKTGGTVLAATQHNLHAMQPLQFDAGLSEGLVCIEAFPTKDGTTTVHDKRLEFRHPSTGIADPRVYMLAMLSGLNQGLDGTVPARAMQQLRDTRVPGIYDESDSGIKMLEAITTWDIKSNRLVMPAQIQESARGEWFDRQASVLMSHLTSNPNAHYLDNNAYLLRVLAGAVRLPRENRLVIDPKSPYAEILAPRNNRKQMWLERDILRVLPSIHYDSPEIHAERRKHIARSSTVRTVLGKAIDAVYPVNEAVERRQALIDGQMVVSEAAEYA